MKFKALSNNERKLDLNWRNINIYTSKWKPGTSFEVDIVKRQPKKSDPLRKYFFAEVLPKFGNHSGYEVDEYGRFYFQLKIVYFEAQPELLERFGLKPVYKDKKNVYRNVPSVFSNDSKLPVSEKKKFVDWVIRKGSMDGAYIEDPGGDR